ncbi:hypothetical protein HOLleu_39093 [Holothuria leucospilota]|uniref:Uncharacterized protein n=1 Tax=Holothuria leucospilota TaxID=206669 RepID=A0A9Q0YMX6_HOLLE|nr:hypothetical protein HOLleu_39093 [Holothuria leucospilota]
MDKLCFIIVIVDEPFMCGEWITMQQLGPADLNVSSNVKSLWEIHKRLKNFLRINVYHRREGDNNPLF